MDLRISGHTAVVTGAAAGIGLATAAVLAEEGVRVIAVDIDGDRLQKAVASLPPAAADEHVAITADLSTAAGVTEAMTGALIAAGGAVDAFVSCAGRCEWIALDQISDEDWSRTLELNLMATVRAVRLLLPVMAARGRGAIVVVGSDIAKQPEPGPAHYAASKAALQNFAKSLALVAGPAGIRVNTVAPGPIWTDIWDRQGGIADQLADIHGMPRDQAVQHELDLRELPLGRMGRPAEVADLICYLVSERASFTTASTYDVGGGSNRAL